MVSWSQIIGVDLQCNFIKAATCLIDSRDSWIPIFFIIATQTFHPSWLAITLVAPVAFSPDGSRYRLRCLLSHRYARDR